MAKLKEELWKTLQELKEEDFRKFKWFLTLKDNVEGYAWIPIAELEKAGRQDTVDLLVQTYKDAGALTVTMRVLEKISKNDLVAHLENFSTERRDTKNCPCNAVIRDLEKKKAELGNKIKQMIQERQMKIREIKCSADLSNKSANRYKEESKRVHSVFLQTLNESLDNLIKSIDDKQKKTQEEAKEFIQELEQEIFELRERSAEVEKLPTTKDQPYAQSFAYVSDIPPVKNWAETNIQQPSYGGSVAIAVQQLEEKLSKEKEKYINKGKLYRVQQFAKDVTLDPNTANPYLTVSDNYKQVYCGKVKQNLSDNSKRFLSAANVLGKETFSFGRFYYEVQVKGKKSWDLGVVKESIDRKGSITANTENGYWTICFRNGQHYLASAKCLQVKSHPKTVGVFVDYEIGNVSFFDVDSAELLHKFTECSFTENLYPFFSPGPQLDGKNLTPLVISPVKYNN